MTGDDGGVSKEVLPDSEPFLAVLGLNLLAVAHPVSVPVPESRGVVNTVGVNGLDFETSTLELINEPSEWGGSISSWEDVSVHEKTPEMQLEINPNSFSNQFDGDLPDEILELPTLSQSSDLKEKDSIIVKHIINLSQERLEVSDTNVLGHLQARDSLVLSFWNWNISVIHAKNSGLRFLNTSTTKSRVSPSSLVLSQSDTSNMSAIVDGSVLGKSSPSTADVEHTISGLNTNLLADNLELVVLHLLERFFLVDVGNDTRGVDHAWSKEPTVEIITAVVMVTDLFLI